MDVFDRWPNFSMGELLSPAGIWLYTEKGVLVLDVDAVDFLQDFRTELGKQMLCNMPGHYRRGWRSPEENRRIYQEHRLGINPDGPEIDPKDNRFSFHTSGCAFDITCPDIPPGELFLAAREYGWQGLGLYDSFVHMDLRDGPKAEWSHVSGGT